MIMTMHRLKRLIGSFYHQKRIDIIITDSAHYIQSDGTWKQKNVVIHPYAAVQFTRSDGQLAVNSGMTLMRINYRDDEHRGLSLPGSENGANRWLTPPTFVPFPRDWWRNILG